MVLAELTLTDVLWSMVAFFFLFIWIMILINIFGDLFRDPKPSGAEKVLWVVCLLFLPFLTAFIYLVVRGKGMAERSMAAQAKMQDQFDSYVRETAGSGNAADQIAKAKELLDAGAIDQAEFDSLKAKALA